MRNFRKSNLLKSITVFLALAILNLSCSTESIQNSTGCSNLTTNITDFNHVPFLVNSMLDYTRTLHNQENYSTLSEFHEEIFGISQIGNERIAKFELESNKYKSLGFNAYLSQSSSISKELKGYLTDYSENLTSFLNLNHPTIIEFSSFIDNNINQLSTSTLCLNDKQLMNLYLSTSLGFAKYYYSHFYSHQEIQNRSCNFWEALGCGLLAITVGLVLTAVGVILAIGTWVFIDENGKEQEFSDTKETISDTAAVLFWLSLGVYAGLNVYDWCCGKDKVPQQTCLPPNMASYTSNGCNNFTYRISGPSKYGATNWLNNNTNPSIATTPNPTLRLSVPSFGNSSQMRAQIACLSSGSSGTIFPWNRAETFSYNAPQPSIQWAQAPPNNAFTNTDYSIAIYAYGNGVVYFTVTPFGGIVNTTGNSYGNLRFFTSGTKTVTATIFDSCTGLSNSVSKQVFVN